MKAALIALLLLSSSTRATVVFIDVNNSVNEVEIARKRAQERGEDFLVLPNPDAAVARKIKELQRADKEANKRYTKANCFGQMLCDGKYSSPLCEKMRAETETARARVHELTNDKMNPQKITEALKGVYAGGGSVSSLIVSGEDGGSVFGAFGTLRYEELKDAFEAVPQLKQDVQSLYLWGCYTGTAERYSEVWKDCFPNAKLLAGFHDAGPADTSDSGHALLGKLMKAENEAFKTYGEKAVGEFFRRFKEVKMLNSSMCINGQYVDGKHNFPINQFKATGEKCVAAFPRKLHEVYDCYFNANAKCETPPKNHQSGELREYYSYLRNNQHCLNNPFFRNAIPNAGNPDNAIRLIYYDRIWDNFLDNHGADMKRLNTLFKALGLPDDAQFKGDKSMTRQQLMQWMTRVNEHLAGREDPQAQYVKEVMSQLGNTIINLSRWRIPDSWIAGRSSEQPHYSFEVKADCNAAK